MKIGVKMAKLCEPNFDILVQNFFKKGEIWKVKVNVTARHRSYFLKRSIKKSCPHVLNGHEFE